MPPLTDPVASTLQQFTFLSKYARERYDGMRETWDDAVDRVRDMHRRRYPALDAEITDAFELVRQRRVMPSMRSMQFGGLAQDVNHARGYNCAATPIDRVDAFAEYFYLLLCGCGVGISVQREHLAKLPTVRRPVGFERFVVEDTIEGWADAVQALMRAYLSNGARPEFDYTLIRPEGAPIVTGGGMAPGPEPLRRALNDVRRVLEFCLSRGDNPWCGTLRPIDAYDICMHLSSAVMAGGVRRSATAVLFSVDDRDMLLAKTGDWHKYEPQRARSNNSAVLDRATATRDQFAAIVNAAREYGEPGFYFTDNPLTHLTNPCVTGDTWVHTLDGPRPIGEIARMGRFDAMLDGVPHRSVGLGSRGVKPVFRVRTRKGFEIRATAEHKVMTKRGWSPVDHLRVGKDKMRLSANRNGTVRWSGNGTWDEGWLLGHLYGNGTFTDGSARLDFWGDDRWFMLGFAKACLDGAFGPSSRRKGSSVGTWSDTQADKVSIYSRDLAQLAEDYGMIHGSKAPGSAIERTSYAFHCGFLSGWFDADGTVAERVAQGKGIDVRLSCTDDEMLQRAQRMLARVGVISRIYRDRQPAGMRPLPDGKGGSDLYDCKAGHELVIGKDNAVWFAERVGFQREHKKQRLGAEIAAFAGRGPYSESFYDTVVSVEPDGEEEVFDVQVEDVHAFDANGLYISNCYEIGLHPYTDSGESGVAFCNLTTINGAACRTPDEFYVACRAAALIGTLQAGYTDFPYLSAASREIARRDALLGVSICGFLDHPGLLLDPRVLRDAAHSVRVVNEGHADTIGINPAARLTCVKPDGTVSLALGLDVAGIHPAHARRYIRRIRCAANDPVFQAFRYANPHAVEQDVMDPTGKTWIAAFPVDVDADAVLRTDIDALTFMRNVVNVQRNWVDPGTVRGSHRHAVSNTCTVRDGEWDIVEQFIWDNRNEIAAVSLLSDIGDKVYTQAPREAVSTPEDYERWESLREHWRTPDWGAITGSANVQAENACAGGMCEL